MKKVILLSVELVFLIWFFLPFLLKRVINVGNLFGMCATIFALVMTLWNERVQELLMKWREYKLFFYGEWAVRSGAVLILLLLVVSAGKIAVAGYEKAPAGTPVLVLGCKVNGEKPSTILEERIDAAYDYLSKDEDAVCILSGGKGIDEGISEALCMYHGLTKRGIAKERLILEDASTSTKENMEYSKAICVEEGIGNKVVIITSEFHEYRARLLAKEQGFTTYAYGASTNLLYFPTYFLREVLGVLYMSVSGWFGK